MLILPVLDVRGGIVVRARGGRREGYLPFVSPACSSSSPLSRIAQLLQLYPFPYLYVADLDAIQGKGDNRSVIEAITRKYPRLKLWVDAGIANRKGIVRLLELGVSRPVVGTETLPNLQAWERLRTWPGAERLILSLDYQEGCFLGPCGLNQKPTLWPSTVIAMSLDRVGSKKGPDWKLLAQLRQHRPQGGKLLAAGGIRGLDDIMQLARRGMSGVLLASALDNGSLGPVALQRLL